MIRFLIHRPIAVLMSFLALTILGIMASFELPISLLPDIQIPEVSVHIAAPKYNARELENFAVKGLRRQLMECSGIDGITSEARDGKSILRLKFKHGVNTSFAAIDVNDKIDRAMNWLPVEVGRPKVIKASATDIPILYLNIYQDKKSEEYDFLQLSDFAKNVISRRIEQLDEVALVDISGTESSEIVVIPDQEKLRLLGLSNDVIADLFQNNNLPIGNIQVKDGNLLYNIRFSSQLADLEDIRKLYINVKERIIELKDIAVVLKRPRKSEGMFLVNNNRGISLAVIKQSESQLASLKGNLDKIIKQLKNDYPGLVFQISQDQSAFLEYSMHNLKLTLIIGALLAFCVVWVFMSDIRLSLLVGITIPVCVFVSFFFFFLFGISINIISLSGLILGTGLIIDNAIIVIEVITQSRERGLNIADACVAGVNDIIVPLMSSILTTASIFIPLVFISGVAGALFFDQAVAVCIGLGISFICSITFLPVIYFGIYKNNRFKAQVGHSKFVVESLYHNGLNIVFKHKAIACGLCLAIVIGSYFIFDKIPKEIFPPYAQQESILYVDWNENLSIDENQIRAKGLVDLIKIHTIQTNIWVGTQDYLLSSDMSTSASEAKIYIQSSSFEKLKQVKETLLMNLKKKYTNANFSFENTQNIFEKTFVNKEPPFMVKLNNSKGENDFATTIKTISLLSDEVSIPIKNNLVPASNVSIEIDFERLMLYKVPLQVVYDRLLTALNQKEIGSLNSSYDVVPVVIASKESDFLNQLREIKIINQDGILIGIGDLISIKNILDFKRIVADQESEYVPVEYDVTYFQRNVLENEIKKILGPVTDKVDYSFSGATYSFSSYITEFLIVLLVSIVLLYFILAAQFESLLQPLILLVEIPIDIAAALWILYLFGGSFNIMSAIGIIVMTGIIINDSILKIDAINYLHRHKEMDLMAAIHEGGRRRLRPIIMTSLTTLLAEIPVLFGNDLGSSLQKPLALALVGGLTVGTLVSLYIIPLIYFFIYRDNTAPVSHIE